MQQVEKYFNSEKSESLLFIAIGIAALALSAYFFIKLKQIFYNGMAFPLIFIALIQITVGSIVWLRSPKDIHRMNQIIQKDTPKIKTEEIPRMNKVMKNFALYRWIEIVLIIMGLALFVIFPPISIWKGIGTGLFIQAGLMLLLDFFAESRAKIYLAFLNSLL